MSKSDALRMEADKLRAQAEEVEASARRAEEIRATMTPQQRVAILLHDELARTYRGAGGGMDGGDPWYYEIDGKTIGGPRELYKHQWGGEEHRYYLGIADELAQAWAPTSRTTTWDTVWEELEEFLAKLCEFMKYTSGGGARRREAPRADARVKFARDRMVEEFGKTIDGLIENIRKGALA